MEKIDFLELSGPNLLVQYGDLVEKGIKKAVREALFEHKRAGNPVAVLRDGKVVVLQPEEIEISE